MIEFDIDDVHFNFRTSAIVISHDEKRILMTTKKDMNYYTLPGGRVQGGEDTSETIRRRFKEDMIYKVMGGVGDGIGNLMLSCLNCFPATFEEYKRDKEKLKKFKEMLDAGLITQEDYEFMQELNVRTIYES